MMDDQTLSSLRPSNNVVAVSAGCPSERAPDPGRFFKDPAAGGLKYDGEKPRTDLLDYTLIEGIAQVLGFGAKKYAADNWRKGISIRRLLGAALRHTFAFLQGEDKDQESGLSHLYHAGCCLMFAAWMMQNRPDLDDRYKGSETKEPVIDRPSFLGTPQHADVR